ncbi:MAG: nucleoside permease [Ferruginibacter sp.]|nr:nucleoside permease [Ferruginibacter sp.]
MSIKLRLTVLSFLQFFVWGAWLISAGDFLFKSGFSGTQIGAVYSTLGLASLFMPSIMGIIADKYINAERLLGICHIISGVFLVVAAGNINPSILFWIMFLNSCFYMPTIALTNSVSYNILVANKSDVVKEFPPIRVWGTVGFIAAMWIVDVTGWKDSNMQFYFSAILSFIMGVYSFTMPKCIPMNKIKSDSWVSKLGLDAFVLLKEKKMFIFFMFALLLGAALQVTNTFGGQFLRSFGSSHPDSFVVKHEIFTLSISQISESLFILAIPFFLKRFGIKKVMFISMIAWVFRFGLFGIGDPGNGLFFLIASMIIYGMAFDFFNISGSLYVEQETNSEIRASAQGLFMFMTNGVGAVIGSFGSGLVVDFFTKDNVRDWPKIWMCFAGYALVVAILFAILFKHKHNPNDIQNINH